MKRSLKNIIVCFIAAPLVAMSSFAASDSAGMPPGTDDLPPRGEFEGPDARGQGRPQRGHPLISLADTDGDGRLSSAEIKALPGLLLSFDADNDGVLDQDEMRSAMPPPEPPPGRGGDRDGPPRGGRGPERN
jgi:hypothetical protein